MQSPVGTVAGRLLLVAHGATAGTRDVIFGDRGDVLDPAPDIGWPERMATLCSGPEPACRTTARSAKRPAEVVRSLAGPDLGCWTGRSLHDVQAVDPGGLSRWLSDPEATPHGGESLADLIRRAGAYCDVRQWPPGWNVAVVTPLVARAVAVHALGAASEVIFRIDVAPLGRVGLSRTSAGWRLQQLGKLTTATSGRVRY